MKNKMPEKVYADNNESFYYVVDGLPKPEGLTLYTRDDIVQSDLRTLAAAVVDLSNPYVMQPMARTKHSAAITLAQGILNTNQAI